MCYKFIIEFAINEDELLEKIIVEDDGIGMNFDIIENVWLK